MEPAYDRDMQVGDSSSTTSNQTRLIATSATDTKKGLKIVAKSVVRELRDSGLEKREMLAFAASVLEVIVEEFRVDVAAE